MSTTGIVLVLGLAVLLVVLLGCVLFVRRRTSRSDADAGSAASLLGPQDREELEDLERRVLAELSEAEHDELFHAVLDRIKRSVPIRSVSADALSHSIRLGFADGFGVIVDSRDQRLALRLLSLSQQHPARLHWAEWRQRGVALGLMFGRVEIEVIAVAEA